ncbi:hypothetical protein BH11ARM2_BH11ARM2_10930 [soil metagenome]
MLEEATQGSVESVKEGSHAIVRVRWSGGTHTLLCEQKARVWPNELPGMAARFRRDCQGQDTLHCLPLLLVPSVSDGLAEACLNEGISWMDGAGNCDIRSEGLMLRIRGEANPYRESRDVKSLHSPKASRIIHALLAYPHRDWKTAELASVAGVSTGLVPSVRAKLIEEGWVESSHGHLRVIEPRKLLENWQRNYRPKRREVPLITLLPILGFEKRLAAYGSDYALTGFASAERYAPYTRYQKIAFYVLRWKAEDAKMLDLAKGKARPM